MTANLLVERSNAMPNAENEVDLFDVALESETKRPKQSRVEGKFGKPDPNRKRQKKNEKYGFGGKKRHNKSGDAMSSADMRDYSVKGKGKTFGSKKRLGKSRRTKD
jgi:rRNA-processing protein EBP2